MKEFRALVKHRKYKAGQWTLAVPGERVYKTFEEAEDAIQKAINNGKPRMIKARSKDGEYVDELFDNLEIMESKVESREVSEWVEE